MGIFAGLGVCRPVDLCADVNLWVGVVDLFKGVMDIFAGVVDLCEGVVDRPAGLHGRDCVFCVFVFEAWVLNMDGEAERVDGGLADSDGVLNRFELTGNRDGDRG